MFIEPPSWLPDFSLALATQTDDWISSLLHITRVKGGANNALYRVEAGGQSFACKLFAPDDRRRAWREFSALQVLKNATPRLAPEPLWLDESCTSFPYPLVVYRWVAGEPLDLPLNQSQLAAFVHSYQRLHAVRPEESSQGSLLDAWFHWFDYAPYLAELVEFLSFYGSWLAKNDRQGPALANRLIRLVSRCQEKIEAPSAPDPRRDSIPLCLCRVDPNLRNAVWDRQGQLTWVDWEYSGWGDPAMDLADLRWHASLEALGEETHLSLRNAYRQPPEDSLFGQRLVAWDILLATRWPFLVLRLYWTLFHGPDRMRLSLPLENPDEVRARMIRFIARAEALHEVMAAR